MKANKKAPAPIKVTRADNKKPSHSIISTVSRCQQERNERTTMGGAIRQALQEVVR